VTTADATSAVAAGGLRNDHGRYLVTVRRFGYGYRPPAGRQSG
jgi:hypothetical protein